MVEVARTQLAETLGWPLAEMQSSGRVPVVARTEIDYLRPARLGDRLEIHASLHLMEKIRFILAFDLRRSSDNTLVARCTQTMVTVQLPSGRPQRVPAAWTDAYPELLAKQQTR
jgi:YbgC/YbaW family acyl-CoA thioester hydrolase